MRSHANRGKQWEGVIDALHALYESMNIALCIRTPPNMKIVKAIKGGQFLAYFEKQGPPDYMIIHNGLPIMAEAKDCAQTRFSFKKIPHHQASRLDCCDAMNGLSVVLLRHGPTGTKWVVPWRNISAKYWSWWKTAARRGKTVKGSASLTIDEIRSAGLEWGRTGYLNPLMKWYKSLEEEE